MAKCFYVDDALEFVSKKKKYDKTKENSLTVADGNNKYAYTQ